MSEFKIPGDRYVSQWNGSPANSGTALAPYVHPANAPINSSNIVIGSGIYKGGWVNNQFRAVRSDGIVILDFQGGVGLLNSTDNEGYGTLIIRNHGSGIVISGFSASIRGIIFENFAPVITGGGIMARNNIYLVGSSLQENTRIISHCIFFEENLSTSGNGTVFRNCYFDKNSIVEIKQVNDTTINNMINGKIFVNQVNYELKRDFNGNIRLDADPNILDYINIDVQIYSKGNFCGEPKFIDLINRIVEPDSDLLKKVDSVGFIGGVRPGKSIPVNSSDSDVTITTTDIDTSNPTNWVIQSPATSGTIKIVWKLSDNISEIQRLLLDALLSFDGSVAGGSVVNNNVPDIFPTAYTPLSQVGLKPNRLTYALRTSQSISKPVIDAEWDNDNVALGTTVGAFYIQEWNTKPTIVTVIGVQYGNGNPESIGGVSNGINARWAEAEIRLTNNRSF